MSTTACSQIGQQALDAAAASVEPVLTVWVHNAMMNAAGFTGDFDAAVAHLIALLKECKALDTPYWRLNADATQAVVLAVSGDHQRAVPLATAAVETAEVLGHPEGIAWAYYALAQAVRVSDLDVADVALAKALASTRSNGGHWNEGLILMEQLSLEAERGDRSAVTTALEVLAHLERAGGRAQLWEAICLSCQLLVDVGRLRGAAVLLAAVADRPKQPRPEAVQLVDRLATRVAADLDDDERGRAKAEGRFLTTPEIVQRCGAELEAMLGEWTEEARAPATDSTVAPAR